MIPILFFNALQTNNKIVTADNYFYTIFGTSDLSHCYEGNGHLPDEKIKKLHVHILSYWRDL